MIINQKLLCSLSYLCILLVFLFSPINELLISYYLPQLPYFDFYPLLLASVFCYLYLTKIGSLSISFDYIVIFFIFIVVFFVTLISDVVTDLDGKSTLYVNMFFLRKLIGYLVLGVFCANYAYKYQIKYSNYPFWIFTVILLTIVDWRMLKLDTFSYPNQSQWGNYHYLSECYAILSFWFISSLEKKPTIILISSISIIVLFLLGSRSSLFIYLLVLTLLLYRLNCLPVSLGLCCIMFIAVVFSSKGLQIVNNFIDDNYRMFSVLISNEEGSSVSRKMLATSGLEDIKNHWFVGSLGGQVNYGGKLWGGYIHDFRSYWRQFGIIVFLLYCILLLKLNISNLFKFFRNHNATVFFVTSSLLFFSIESILSRAYLSTYIYFFIGYSISNVFKKGPS